MKAYLKNKEMEILLCCAGIHLEFSRIQRLKKLVTEIIDWQPVIDFAIANGLINFFYLNLKKHCKESSVSLVKLLSLFKENNIDAVPFKGPVQAQLLYMDTGLRSFSDLDILVKKKDAVSARDLLFANGFITDVAIPDRQIETYLKKENFFHLVNKSGTINIDLHWELTGRYSLKPLFYDDLEEQFEQIDLIGKSSASLSLEDMLIYLCIHGTSHCWEKLEMICSVAEIIKSKKIKDWDRVITKASLLKCKRMVYLGLILAERIFETNLPKSIKNKVNNDDGVQKLSKKVIEKIMHQSQGYTESLNWRFSSIHFSVRDSLLDKVKYGIRLFFQPTIREWDKYPLPGLLLFLYYFLRPYRLISEGFRKHHA